MLFKNSVRTSKRTPHFTITKINLLTLFKFNPLKPKREREKKTLYAGPNWKPHLRKEDARDDDKRADSDNEQ
jgi:hypothetical protein